MRSRRLAIGSIIGACAMIGCGSAEFGPVSGTVTLDGEPVDGARVITQSTDTSEGSQGSYGITDKQGRYELREIGTERAGARVGRHSVRITKTDFSYDGGATDVPSEVKDYLPAYASSGELAIDVTAAGDQDYDFSLTTR